MVVEGGHEPGEERWNKEWEENWDKCEGPTERFSALREGFLI